jgi:AcrR family transcriptional regulator
MSMVASRGRPRDRNPQGEGARLRDELIDAAGRLLTADDDVDSLSLRGVAREAGVAAPSVYLHFASKEDLLRAVVSAHFVALQRAVEAGVASGQDPASRLLAGCLAYCRYAVEQPGSYKLLFNTPRPDIKDAEFTGTTGAAAFQTLVDGVAACIATGVARPGDPFRIATDIWSALHGTASLRRATAGFPWPPLEEQVRGILEAFAGIPYRDQSTVEETTDDGAA